MMAEGDGAAVRRAAGGRRRRFPRGKRRRLLLLLLPDVMMVVRGIRETTGEELQRSEYETETQKERRKGVCPRGKFDLSRLTAYVSQTMEMRIFRTHYTRQWPIMERRKYVEDHTIYIAVHHASPNFFDDSLHWKDVKFLPV